jgi:hypothetical protein
MTLAGDNPQVLPLDDSVNKPVPLVDTAAVALNVPQNLQLT